MRVLQFQLVSGQGGYDVMILVEVTDRPSESNTQVALSEAAIEEIEELTSLIDGQA